MNDPRTIRVFLNPDGLPVSVEGLPHGYELTVMGWSTGASDYVVQSQWSVWRSIKAIGYPKGEDDYPAARVDDLSGGAD